MAEAPPSENYAAMGGAWKHSLFDFSDLRTFLLSWLLGPCQLGQDRAAMNGRKSFLDEPVDDFVLPLFCGLCVAVHDRGVIRQKYNIEGEFLNDLISMLFCGPCAITQQTRELIDDNLPAALFM